MAGYISALPRGRRFAASAVATLAAIVLVQLSGAAGIVRNQLGRGGLELVSADRIGGVFRGLSREMTPGSQQNVEELRRQGLTRLLAWTNVVVPVMTPETIPYRGLDGFFSEAVETFQIASVSGQTIDDQFDAGLLNAPATLYGFMISAYTSVEFTLAADAWSRGGGPMVLLFSFIAALAMTIGELCAYRLCRYGGGVATILALPVAKAAFFDANVVPLLPTLRGIVLYTTAMAVVVVAVEFARRPVRLVGRRVASARARGGSRVL